MSDTTMSKPVTPRRSSTMQILSALFRTPTRRPKRTRSRTSSSPSSPRNPVLPAVVLQTYSVSTDSIVLTSLPSAPFCCHEDLLTMSRPQLEGVVRALNERLPRRMRIAPEDDFWWYNDLERPDEDDGISQMSEADMRRRVEELVGIRTASKNRVSKTSLSLDDSSSTVVPSAPKAVRTRGTSWRPYEITNWEMDVYADEDRGLDGIDDAVLGSSPLAFRSRIRSHSRGRSETFPRLAILQEENEGGESKEDEPEDDETRPSKKQRRSFDITADDNDEGPEAIQGARGSRLIENIDVSASSLFTREGDSMLDNSAQPEQHFLSMPDRVHNDVKQSKPHAQVPVLRRRSARIALKQAASADAEKVTKPDADQPRISSPQLKSPRSSADNSTHIDHMNSSHPKTFTIRLPFTSTPPNLKPTSWASSAPRILRSQSQRLSAALKPGKLANEKTTLGRSRSERLPRALDLTFVTVDRPRYRFSRRKSKGSKAVTTQEEPLLAGERGIEVSGSSGRRGYHSVGMTKDTEKSPIVATSGSVYAFPLTLCNSLAPRSRAPSTSTAGSTCGSGDSPSRLTSRLMNSRSVTNDVIANGVQAALGRMVVD